MNNLIQLSLVGLVCVGTNAYASYKRLAECTGKTDKRVAARVILFVNADDDTQGLVVAALDKVGDYASNTKIDWEANSDGFPRIYDNDYDLDIVIDNVDKSIDDMLIGEQYIPKLTCVYKRGE